MSYDPLHWLAGAGRSVTASRPRNRRRRRRGPGWRRCGGHPRGPRREEALDHVADRIRHGGGKARSVPSDVSKQADIDLVSSPSPGRPGNPVALVCAAGVLTSAPFADTTTQIWDETLAVNLTGTFLCCRAAFTAMRNAGEGRIVTIASLSGIYATEKFLGLAAYNVSKYGVVGLTEAVAEVEGKKHGITAICVSPGAVDTQMLRRANPELTPGLTPADVAELILALLDSPVVPASGANIPLFSNA